LRAKLITVGTALAIIVLLFWNSSSGSLSNSDESLYAQVIREVSQGHLSPLTFSDNRFIGKPPLFFWMSGWIVNLFGDMDWVYRVTPIFSALVLLFIACRISWLSGLLLLGSPLVMIFSRRVMLDVPVTALGALLLACAHKPDKWKTLALWLFAGAGWWMKQHAILPPLAAALFCLLLQNPRVFKTRESIAGALLFFSAVIALYFFQGREVHNPVATLSGIRSDSEGYVSKKPVYLDAILADHPVLWLFPIFVVISALKWTSEKSLSQAHIFFLGSLFSLLSLFVAKATLPHYLIPAFTFALIGIGELLNSGTTSRQIKMLLFLVIAVQVCRAQAFRFSSEDPDLNPAPATKSLGRFAALEVPLQFPICAFETYFVGIRYYANRPTLGFYSSSKMFSSIGSVAEFNGLVSLTTTEELKRNLMTKCGGYLILPTKAVGSFPDAKVLHSHPPLSLIYSRQKFP
jgi:4-amino-4-deoxy-L-arabinose transferase-like glycosyltransferase